MWETHNYNCQAQDRLIIHKALEAQNKKYNHSFAGDMLTKG